MATGGLRYWNDGRDVPDVMLALCDYPEDRESSCLQSGSESQFRGRRQRELGLSLHRKRRRDDHLGRRDGRQEAASEGAGLHDRHFHESDTGSVLEGLPREVSGEQTEINASSQDTYAPPSGYSDSVDHFRAFFEGMRSRKPVVEDAVFGFRAAGAALLTNRSLFENQAYAWNPETMSVSKERPA